MALLEKADGTLVARIEVADTPLARLKGLLGRRTVAPDEGMLFRPAGAIHMFFMRTPLDVVFCDRDLRVVKVVRGLRPWRTAAARGARVTIELGVGGADGLAPGEQLALRP